MGLVSITMSLSISFCRSQKLLHNQKHLPKADGFTLIELMIVVGVIAIIVMLALPVYSDYSIRAKIGEALSLANAAKTSVSATCQEDPLIAALTPENSGYTGETTKYVASIDLSGPCTLSVITIVTQSTGAVPDPILTITGTLGEGNMTFVCASTGPNRHVPKTCRT